MKCDTCHKSKPDCSCSKGFTPAVVKIENPEELVLFHKVIVPASMGDEKDTPVTIGKYCNVLMVYEANGHAYLYSSDGIPSKIAFDSGGVLYVDDSKLPEADKASVGFLYITNNGTAAITNDNEHWTIISGGGGVNDFELLINRPMVDGQPMTGQTDIPLTSMLNDISKNTLDIADLNADLVLEEAAREAGDQANANAIAAETQARAQADNALSSRIDSLSASLSAEEQARTQADATLQANIDAEALARQNADAALGDRIDAEKTAREAADTNLQTSITNNYNTLDGKINTEVSALSDRITAEAQARADADAGKVDKVAGKGLSTNDFTNADKDALSTALQPDDIDYTVMTDLKMKPTASTTSVVMEGDKVNLKEGTPSDFEIPLPVASSTQAGVMNTATYDTIQNNTAKINALEGGAVAITGIAASPAQTDLTNAWKTATGQTTLINGASILDVDNDLRWTYYSNTDTWYSAPTGGTVTINPFTNTEAGTIKGSTVDGQVHAETDGTGSVQGWDTVKADIATHTSQIAAKVDKEAGKGLSTNDFTTAYKDKLDGIEDGAEVNSPLYNSTGNATDGAMTQAATTNALDEKVDKVTGKGLSANDFTDTLKTKLDGIEDGAQVNRPIYTTTGQNTDGAMTQKAITDALDTKLDNLSAGAGIDATQLASDVVAIADSGVTTAKIADANVTTAKLGTDVQNTLNNLDRLHVPLVPSGQDVKLPSGADLNDVNYLKIKSYYASDNATAATILNSPTTKAFIMRVYNPVNTTYDNETTGQWIYRVQEIMTLGGDIYRRVCNTNGTPNNWVYGDWVKTVDTNDTSVITTNMIANNAVTSSKIDWATIPVGLVAYGDINATKFGTAPQGAFHKPGFNYTVIRNSNYAAKNGSSITLQAGAYAIIINGRFSDASSDATNRYFVGVSGQGTDGDLGSWKYGNRRFSLDTTVLLNLAAATTIQPLFYSQDMSRTLSTTIPATFLFVRLGDVLA